MKKPVSILLATLAAAAFMMLNLQCSPKDEPVVDPDPTPVVPEDPPSDDPKPEPADLSKVTGSVKVNDDWVWEGKPQITFVLENANAVPATVPLLVRFTKDVKGSAGEISKEVEVAANSTQEFVITTEEDMQPGFYKAACFINKQSFKNSLFFFGISPTRIVSAPDMKDDFNSFWDAEVEKLESIELKPNLIELSQKSNAKCKVYFVEFQSAPDSPTGDPVTVRGYYLEPTDGKKHPVIMHFYGYDTMGNFVSCPGGNGGNYAEFYLSHRGQYINRAPHNLRGDGLEMDFTNEYDIWFNFQFGDKYGYYYHGAFLDCVQAVNFMATRETSDMNNLFAEGASQGGALTYACAALSKYPFSAIAPCVAFLGDYPDYFKIVSWPGDWAKSCANNLGMTDEQMYAFLSYFDTKNLATRISCPVIASSCLQDGTCPPHTNLAPYNNLLSTEKEIHFYPKLQHEIPKDWPGKTSAFFTAHTQ